jgi:uncharacterized membrane protein
MVFFPAKPEQKKISVISANSSEAGERNKILKELYISQSTQRPQRKDNVVFSGSAGNKKN